MNTFESYLNDQYIKKLRKTFFRKYSSIPEDDITSLYLVTLWECVSTYDNKQSTFHSYFFMKLKYACLGYIRQAATYSSRIEYIVDFDKSYDSPISYAGIVDGLDVEEERLIYKKFILNETTSEIAGFYGLSENRIREKLRETLDKLKILNSTE